MEKKYLYIEIQNFIVNVGWTHKIQICQSEIYVESIRKIKNAKIILTSLTSVGLGGFVLQLFPSFQSIATTITFALSLTTTIVVALDKENEYTKLSIQNKMASNKYWELREKASSLLSRLKTENDVNIIIEEFSELKEIRLQANSELPYTSEISVELAKRRVKENRDNDYSKDYSYFIPEALRNIED